MVINIYSSHSYLLVVFRPTSSELGNFNAFPFVPHGILDLVGPKYVKKCNKPLITPFQKW